MTERDAIVNHVRAVIARDYIDGVPCNVEEYRAMLSAADLLETMPAPADVARLARLVAEEAEVIGDGDFAEGTLGCEGAEISARVLAKLDGED